MSITDANQKPCSAQALTVTAFSEDSVDLMVARNIGNGTPLCCQIGFPVALDSAGEDAELIVRALLSDWGVSIAFTTDFATDDRLDVTAHGLSIGDKVLVVSSAGDLPAGLSSNTVYYVESVPSANEITVAATKGGSAVSLSDNGTGTHSILHLKHFIGSSDEIHEDDLTGAIETGSGADISQLVTFELNSIGSTGARYIHLLLVNEGEAYTAGTVNADIVIGAQKNNRDQSYSSGFTVT